MVQRYFSPSRRGFFSDDVHRRPEDRPDDCVEITAETHSALLDELLNGKDIVWDGTQPVARTPIPTMESIRWKRNRLLRNTDWTQAADVPDETRLPFTAYRQQLRDVPQNNNDPTNVEWPTPPA